MTVSATTKRIRVGMSDNYIIVTQGVSAIGRWLAPVINMPGMNGMNLPVATAVATAIGKAVAAGRELQKRTGRPADPKGNNKE